MAPTPYVTYEDCRKGMIEDHKNGIDLKCGYSVPKQAEKSLKMEILSDDVYRKFGFRLTIVPTDSYSVLYKIRNEPYYAAVIEQIGTAIRTGINPVIGGRKITKKNPNLSEKSIAQIVYKEKNGIPYTAPIYSKAQITDELIKNAIVARELALKQATPKDQIIIKDVFAKIFGAVKPEWRSDLKVIKELNKTYNDDTKTKPRKGRNATNGVALSSFSNQ